MNLYSVVTIKIDDNGNVRNSSVHGIFEDKDTALNIVTKNLGDIFEYYYDYAIVEEFQTGLYPLANILKWVKLLEYKDNKALLEEVECPENFKNMCGFTF